MEPSQRRTRFIPSTRLTLRTPVWVSMGSSPSNNWLAPYRHREPRSGSLRSSAQAARSVLWM